MPCRLFQCGLSFVAVVISVVLLGAPGSLQAEAAPEDGSAETLSRPSKFLNTSGATETPPNRWGEIQPEDILTDQSTFTGDLAFVPIWYDLAIEGNFMYTAAGRFIQIFNISNPKNPDPLPTASISLAPSVSFSDKNHFAKSIAVPPGDGSVAVTANDENGLIVWNTSSKSSPGVHYQDRSGSSFYVDVHAARIGGKDYAFAIDQARGLVLYDLDQAQSKNRCFDRSDDNVISCGSVFRGVVAPTSGSARGVGGTGNFVTYRDGIGGVKIFNASTPTSLNERLTATLTENDLSADTLLWQNGGKYYLALLTGESGTKWRSKLKIYDVSCIASSGSCSLPTPIVYDVTDESGTFALQTFLTLSWSNGKPYIYVGNQNGGSTCIQQREFLFDASNVNALRDITPPVNNSGDGYWGWYYQFCPNPGGFNNMLPQRGMFKDGYFFRLAFSFVDSHCHTLQVDCSGASPPPPPPPPPPGSPPVADFTWSPTAPTTNDTLQFTDTSTGSPTAWSWDFDNDGQPDATVRNPTHQFTSTGTKTVTLTASNDNGSNSIQKNITLEAPPNPNAQVSGVTYDIAEPVTTNCGQVTFTANDVGGSPPLTVTWEIVQGFGADLVFMDDFETGSETNWSNGSLLFSGSGAMAGKSLGKEKRSEKVVFRSKASGNPFTWDVPLDLAPGSYFARVTVSNQVPSSAEAKSVTMTVGELSPLTFTGTPTVEEPTSRLVTFHAPAGTGVTEWNWSFGDGTSSGWVTDPVAGPNPQHEYLPGVYKARVFVRNCRESLGTDEFLETDEFKVPDISPLEANFTWSPNQPAVGATVQFTDTTVGEPDTWNWDFDNNGQNDATVQNPTHSFASEGDHVVSLQVFNPENNSSTVQRTVTVVPPPPPPPDPTIGILTFQAVCLGSTCSATTTQAANFFVDIEGTPEFYDYDWDGDGDFDQTSSTKVTSHLYTTIGCKNPTLRIRKGVEVVTQASSNNPIAVGGVNCQ